MGSIKITYPEQGPTHGSAEWIEQERARVEQIMAAASARGFDPSAYVADMDERALRDLVFYGANLATKDDRSAARVAAEKRLRELSPPAPPPAMNGMGDNGYQLGVTPTPPQSGLTAEQTQSGLTAEQIAAIEGLIGGAAGAADPAMNPGVTYQPAVDPSVAPGGVAAPDYGQAAMRSPMEFGQRESRATPITPAQNAVANNMNNQSRTDWRTRQENMMGGLQQDVFRQARNQGLLDDSDYVTMQGLLI